MLHFSLIRNGVFIAVIAHGLIGISLIWDKVLLKKPGTKNLFSYVFWLGAISVFGVFLVPFGYQGAPRWLIAQAFGTGVLDLIGVFFYYKALKLGEASETLAIMGGFSPVATVAIGFGLLPRQMSGWQLLGFALMTAGGFVMFFSENFPLKKLLPAVLLASALMGSVNVLSKAVYDHTNFVTGYVWFTLGTFAAAMALLIRRKWRTQVFSERKKDNSRNRFWYFVNRFVAGVGAFLVTYAISLTHPALVDAISGARYAIIFLGAYLLTKLRPAWLKENFRGWQLVTKAVATLLVAAGLVLAGFSGENKAGVGSPTATERLSPRRERAGLRDAKIGSLAHVRSLDERGSFGARRPGPPFLPARHPVSSIPADDRSARQ
jgi:drug/metabolite transporter (DMT)-like permease